MSTQDPKALYQAVILDHGHHPRNVGPLPTATHEATAKNPLCGDRVTVRVELHGAELRSVRFEARGCLIARASASLLTEAVTGRGVADAHELARTLDALLDDAALVADAGALEPLRGARDFPARKSCVTLAWRALEQALTRALP